MDNLFILKNHVLQISGDVFIMILENMENLEEQVHLIKSLFEKPFDIAFYKINTSVSIGSSIYQDQATDVENLVNYAELARFEAKQHW